MLLLDTADLPAEHRVDAFRAAFDQASAPCRIEHLGPAAQVRTRMHLWQFGRASLFTTDSSGFALARTAQHLRAGGPETVALAVQSSGSGRFSQFGTDSVVPAGSLMVSDLTAPYAFSWAGVGGSRAFQVPYGLLGLPAEVVRAAAPRLRHSPLHDLVRDHLQGMFAEADEMSADPGAAALGTATVELVRALLVSAAGGSQLVRGVREETLVTRVLTWTRAHLTDPGLDPPRIAAAHNVSLRRLYQLCADAGVSLEQWLIAERLELSRAELVTPAGRHRTVAAVARNCGFSDPSHFARRFRQAYGLTPLEWRESSRWGR